MICPAKKCRMEIDDDSKFCDQCGAEILICPKCHTPGTGKFCLKDGTRLESQRSSVSHQNTAAGGQSAPDVSPAAQNNQPAANPELQQNIMSQAEGLNSTQAFDLNSSEGNEKLIISHSEGLELEISDNDIIGRNSGPHSDKIGHFRFLSRQHAVFIRKADVWCIKDMGSTNKSRLNGRELDPGKEYPVKHNDIIMFADQEFTVK